MQRPELMEARRDAEAVSDRWGEYIRWMDFCRSCDCPDCRDYVDDFDQFTLRREPAAFALCGREDARDRSGFILLPGGVDS